MLDNLRSKHFELWLGGYLRQKIGAALQPKHHGLKHVLFAVCDHYEPLFAGPPIEQGRARVQKWVDDYPRMAAPFRDADGRPPQHSFFFPGEEYRPEFFDGIETLVRGGYGEVELHLHHEDSTEASLRADIEGHLKCFGARGHFSRANGGQIRYAFIHGNWCLANGRPDGKMCGVDAELPLLFSTGCYADFTFPSVPDVSQPNIVNQIYWPNGNLARRRAYEYGQGARVGESFSDRLLMVTGPLAIEIRPPNPVPRLEYGALTANNLPSLKRVQAWVRQDIHIEGRPDWIFVKVYTHGAPEPQAAALLGEGGRALHEALTGHYNDGVRWKLHYVTAREMYNIAKAAMAGKSGDPAEYRDFELAPPPILDGLKRPPVG